MPWYNAFRSFDRVELFSSLIAPAAGFITYRKPESRLRELKSSKNLILRAIKPLALPFCILFISLSFVKPLIKPLDKEIIFNDIWADNSVLLQSAAQTSGPAALISAMYSLNNFADSEYNAAKGTYTDRDGTEIWYLARYAVNSGYRVKFFRLPGIDSAPVPSIIPLPGAGGYIALLKRSDTGNMVIGDPLAGRMELNLEEYNKIYGNPNLVLSLSVPNSR